MNCEEVLELYQRYLDNELRDRRSSSVKDHIENCRQCKKVLIIERRFKAVIIKKIKRQKAPLELKEKIKKQIFLQR